MSCMTFGTCAHHTNAICQCQHHMPNCIKKLFLRSSPINCHRQHIELAHNSNAPLTWHNILPCGNTTQSADMVPAQIQDLFAKIIKPEPAFTKAMRHFPLSQFIMKLREGDLYLDGQNLYIQCYVFQRSLIDRHERFKFTYLKITHNLLQWHLKDFNRSFFAHPKMKNLLILSFAISKCRIPMDMSFDSICLSRMAHIYSPCRQQSHLEPFTLPFYLCLSS